jgi:hypothetical protein
MRLVPLVRIQCVRLASHPTRKRLYTVYRIPLDGLAVAFAANIILDS